MIAATQSPLLIDHFSVEEIVVARRQAGATTFERLKEENGDSPERIDNGAETAPSKRLEAWTNHQYGKTTTGIVVAERIGIDAMRSACPNFDSWIRRLHQAST